MAVTNENDELNERSINSPEDLAALTVEAAAMARVPLAGTDWIPGVKK